MLMLNKDAILVAEPAADEAEHLRECLRLMGHLVLMASSPDEVLRIMRTHLVDRAVVGAELTAEGEPVLARLARLPSMAHLVATGPAGDTAMEVRARRAGAQVYLTRPVGFAALAAAVRTSEPSALYTRPP